MFNVVDEYNKIRKELSGAQKALRMELLRHGKLERQVKQLERMKTLSKSRADNYRRRLVDMINESQFRVEMNDPDMTNILKKLIYLHDLKINRKKVKNNGIDENVASSSVVGPVMDEIIAQINQGGMIEALQINESSNNNQDQPDTSPIGQASTLEISFNVFPSAPYLQLQD